MRTVLTVAAAAAVAITAFACSSPAPTAPSMLAAAPASPGFSTPIGLQPDTAACDSLTGAARGMCHALFQTGCLEGTSPAPACGRLYGALSAATGKQYIANPVQCAVIRFVCAEGTQPFFDSLGCGCEPSPIP